MSLSSPVGMDTLPPTSPDSYYSSLAARTAAVDFSVKSIASSRLEDRRAEITKIENAIRCIDLQLTRESERRTDVLGELEKLVDKTLETMHMQAKQTLSALRKKYNDKLALFSSEVDKIQTPELDIGLLALLSQKVDKNTARLSEKAHQLIETAEEGEKALFLDVMRLEKKAETPSLVVDSDGSVVGDRILEARKKDDNAASDLRLKFTSLESRMEALIKRREESEKAFYDTLNKLIRSVESAITDKMDM